jgi:hypothetical protein
MKWLIGFLLALFMVSAAFAGEEPYIAIVGNDCVVGNETNSLGIPCDANPFYFSEKHQQFLHDQESDIFQVFVCFPGFPPGTLPQTRVGGPGCETFRSNPPTTQSEICDTTGQRGEPNAVIRKQNAGFFEWWIRLPKKPEGEINICIQCGILKPEEDDVMLCAAETGERIGTGFCTRDYSGPGVSPIKQTALPKITAWAYPGPYSLGFTPFRLTAYKNPSTYALAFANTTTKQLKNSVALQVLDGSTGARVLLKSCMDKCVLVKIPVDGQINALGETEADLTAGDLIKVRMDVPGGVGGNTVDIYCHSQSARIMGVGESPF